MSVRNNEMISNNLGLVHACAKRFKGRGIEYNDLYQAGCLGLVKACDNFDSERGVKFSTYAVPVILGEIKRLFRDGGAVKVGRSLKELSLKASKASSEFLQKNGREPTITELSEILQVEPEKASEALCVSYHPISLTADDDEGGSQFDLPVSSEEEKLTEIMALRQHLCELDEKDRQLIYLRFFGEKTQTVTAKHLNMTQVQVSRREKKLLMELREKLIS